MESKLIIIIDKLKTIEKKLAVIEEYIMKKEAGDEVVYKCPNNDLKEISRARSALNIED